MQTKRGRRLIYARPSFLEGMARVMDLGGTLSVCYFVPYDEESDDDALQSDREWMRYERDSRRSYLGLACGFILALLLIAIAGYAVVWGNPWMGVAVIMAKAAGFSALFVYVTNARHRERERKAARCAARRD